MGDVPHARRIREAFRSHFGEPALLVRGPGRVNLIGEHTDFNQGFVLPGAVDRAIWLALRPRSDDRCRFFAADLEERFESRLSDLALSTTPWANYLLGIYSELAKDGHRPPGVECTFGGDLPIGSGMASSAALECGFAFGLNELFGLGYTRSGLALLAQRAENRFVGVACGIMDQFASLLGRENQLICLDCRDLTHAYVGIGPSGPRVVLSDTQVRRALSAGGLYNQRRAQCEAGVAFLAERNPGTRSLRDVSLEVLESHRAGMDPVVYKRCVYVVRENRRVLEGCQALAMGDFAAFGQLMNESHEGLRNGYEVSCPELDILAEAARGIPGVLGSRMMGAGFGGCTVSLVYTEALPDFAERIERTFREKLHRPPVIHVCRLTGGTERCA